MALPFGSARPNDCFSIKQVWVLPLPNGPRSPKAAPTRSSSMLSLWADSSNFVSASLNAMLSYVGTRSMDSLTTVLRGNGLGSAGLGALIAVLPSLPVAILSDTPSEGQLG